MDINAVLELASETAKKVTGSREEWCKFLKTSSNFYKAYQFDEQLLIYAQKPDATACAQMPLWNRKFQRWVDLKAKPITLLHFNQSIKPFVSEVYDVSDTHSLKKETFHLWQIYDIDHEPVIKALHEIYPEQSANQMEDYLMNVASELVKDTYLGFMRYIPKENTFLEELDDYNTEMIFKTTMLASTQYATLYRCGFDPEIYIDPTDMQGIINFNSKKSLAVLGEAIAQTNQMILLNIAQIVNTIRKEGKQHERKTERGRDIRDVRTKESEIPVSTSQRNLRGNAVGKRTLGSSDKSRSKGPGDVSGTDGKTLPGGNGEQVHPVNGRRELTNDLLRPSIQPIVTIEWSESPQLKSGQILALYEANYLFHKLGKERYSHGGGYDKTKFSIRYKMKGEEAVYEGRQDLGEEDGESLIDHISHLCERYSKNQAWKDRIISKQGIEAWNETEETMRFIQKEFVPYLKEHLQLTFMEQKADNWLFSAEETTNTLSNTATTYYTKLKEYVSENRRKINMDSEINFTTEPVKEEMVTHFVDPEIESTYQIAVNEAKKLADLQKKLIPMNHKANDQIDGLCNIYARKLAEHLNASVNCTSHAESMQNREKYEHLEDILDNIRSIGIGPTKLEEKLNHLEERKEQIKAINVYYQQNKTLDGCKSMSSEDILKLKNWMETGMISKKQPLLMLELQSLKEETKLIKKRIEQLSNWKKEEARIQATNKKTEKINTVIQNITEQNTPSITIK